MKAIVFTSTYFDCPRCEKRAHLREVLVERDGLECVEPVGPLQCEQCGRQLVDSETQLRSEGGVVGGGWWFVCGRCLRDSFVDETVYGEGPLAGTVTEGPPSRAGCQYCSEEHDLEL